MFKYEELTNEQKKLLTDAFFLKALWGRLPEDSQDLLLNLIMTPFLKEIRQDSEQKDLHGTAELALDGIQDDKQQEKRIELNSKEYESQSIDVSHIYRASKEAVLEMNKGINYKKASTSNNKLAQPTADEIVANLVKDPAFASKLKQVSSILGKKGESLQVLEDIDNK